jgi:hypothetical protein
VGPRASLDDAERRKILILLGLGTPTALLSSPEPVTILTALFQLLITDQTHSKTMQKHPKKLLILKLGTLQILPKQNPFN